MRLKFEALKAFFALAFLLSGAGGALGQDSEGGDSLRLRRDSLRRSFVPETALGLRGTASLSLMLSSPGIGQGFWLGYGGGLALRHQAERHVAVQFEINYAPKGWLEDWGADNPEQRYRRRMHYLELPLLTQIVAGKRTGFFTLHFGPSFNFLLAETERIGEQATPLVYYGAPASNRFDLSICVGMGALVKTSGGQIALEARYSHSFLNALDNDLFTLSQNQYASASLSYMWAFLHPKRAGKPPGLDLHPKPKTNKTPAEPKSKSDKKTKDKPSKKENPKTKKSKNKKQRPTVPEEKPDKDSKMGKEEPTAPPDKGSKMGGKE